jgi:hypothetical protein
MFYISVFRVQKFRGDGMSGDRHIDRWANPNQHSSDLERYPLT